MNQSIKALPNMILIAKCLKCFAHFIEFANAFYWRTEVEMG